ncbi:MAG: flagellar M-ring protein FliF, partial [Roseobacter sp.]|nr:flagellar M-ring protein FliF [Roseobacter sp.]
MQGLIDNLKSLGKNKLMMLGGAGIGVVLLMILAIGAVSRPDYAPLYSNLSITSANSIEATLANAGFNAMVSEDGT